MVTIAPLLLAGCTPPSLVDLPEPRPPPAGEPASPSLVPAFEAQAEPDREASCDPDHPTVPSPDLRLYATWQQFPLRRAEHGIDGTLRVLQDSRFTRPGFERTGTHPILRPCDALPGRVEVLDAGGQPVQAKLFNPQTDVTSHSFGVHQTVYEARELVHCLASCWCGDHLSFWRVLDGRLSRLSTVRSSGEDIPVPGVTRGCYEGGGVRRDQEGRLEVLVHRTVLLIPGGLSAEEHHFWDGSTWRGTSVERKIPW